MVHVVGPEPGAHQLLEQVGLLVGALRGAEARQGGRAFPVADPLEPGGGEVQCLLPARLAEAAEGIRRVQPQERLLGGVRPPDQGHGEALGMVDIVEAVTTLDAQPPTVGGAVTAGHVEDAVASQVVAELAADTAIGTDRVDAALGRLKPDAAGGHQGAGGAGLDALATGHTGALAQGVAQVEDDLRLGPPAGESDHVVHLDLAAGPQAAGALDAGVQVDRDGRMTDIRRGLLPRREAGTSEPESGRPEVQLAVPGIGGLGHVRLQQFQDHSLGPARALAQAVDDHAVARLAAAGRGQDPLAGDLHHTGAAVAVGSQTVLVAEVRDLAAEAAGRLEYGLALQGGDGLAVQRELHGTGFTAGRHGRAPGGSSA